ncbi:hypothetical protein CTI12_AA311280 [Artemisia annua]|uniref:Uncharacterized protein n=1 Tax=Artemisia annua TaxID=35608 RepID=A0A2U1N3C4_ARTAN|nr:hypothetical protein CTI12_AA311280 [Artemisia annua]
MKTQHFLSHILLLWLLLLPSFHNALPSKVYETKSVHFKIRTAQHNSKPGSIYSSTPREEKKVYKQPSGPNPSGNNRPPTRRLVEVTRS